MIINYEVNTLTRASWSGSFTVTNRFNSVLTELPSKVKFNPGPGSFEFDPLNFSSYSDPNVKYVTWRTYTGSSQYPDSGYSFDVWSDELYDAIIGNASWDDLITTGTFNLNTEKNTLIYDYDTSGFPFDFYGKGGIITFT